MTMLCIGLVIGFAAGALITTRIVLGPSELG